MEFKGLIKNSISLFAILAISGFLASTPLRAEIDPYSDDVKKVLKSLAEAQAGEDKGGASKIPKVLQYLKDDSVIIDAGHAQGIVDGATLYSFRQRGAATLPVSEEKGWIKTGKMKAIHVDDQFTLAKIIAKGDEVAQAFFPDFPVTMAGDAIAEARFHIVKNPVAVPERSFRYKDLFVDPMADPVNFELSEAGKARLKQLAKTYAALHLPVLMVGAYTDPTGAADANQVESYQRALTVRHFMVDEAGFKASRVVAIGYGESEQINDNYLPGYEDDNRRIVFKVNVHIAPHH